MTEALLNESITFFSTDAVCLLGSS